MQIVRVAWAAGFLSALLALTGCGESGMAEVKGTVKVDGKPVPDGAISFFPTKGPTAGGFIKEGQYSAKVSVGLTKVKISAPKVVGHKKLYPRPNSPEAPITVEALPSRYNSATTLELDVKPGANEKNWDLQSK